MLVLLAVAAPIPSLRADDDIANGYRLTLSPYYPIKGDFSGFGQLEYRDNPDRHNQAYEALWPGMTYSVRHWVQLSGGLVTRYTDNVQGADRLELRPFAGVKLFVPNDFKWKIYNYTRYEYRDTMDLDSHIWTDYSRVRSRFGVEFPLASLEKAWQPKAWYGLADVEPFYRFDTDKLSSVNVRGGLGYVLNHRLRLEFIYYAQFTRPNGGSLEHTDNILQLNVRIGLAEGLLAHILDPGGKD